MAERLLAGRLPRAHALGRTDRLGPGTEQPVRLTALRAHFPDVPLIIDAGIGVPSHAAQAHGARLRCGADQHRGRPGDAIRWQMAAAFALAVEAGRAACAGRTRSSARDFAAPSTPVIGTGVPRMNLPRVYPIVDSAAWVARLAATGVRLVQLRIKDAPAARCAREIRAARAAVPLPACSWSSTITGSSRSRSAATSCIWARAISTGADLAGAAPRRRAPRRQHARRCASSSGRCGCGPTTWRSGPSIPTLLKVMPWAPQGLARTQRMEAARRRPLPLVAIGGLTLERLPGCLCRRRRRRRGRDRHRARTRSHEERARAWLAAAAAAATAAAA